MGKGDVNFPRPSYEPNMWAAGGAVLLVIAAGAWAISSDYEPVPRRTGDFMEFFHDSSGDRLVGCFQEQEGGPVGTLELDPDEAVNPKNSTWRYKFVNYAGQFHYIRQLAGLHPYEYPSYDGALDSPQDKAVGNEIDCIEPIPLPDGFPANAFSQKYFMVTHRSGQSQAPDSMTGPYTDKTTLTDGNATKIPGYGTAHALHYGIPQDIATS